MFGDLEKTCLAILAKTCSVILAKTCSVIFGENVFGDFWRKRFGDNVGVLEKRGRRGYGDFVLEFAMKQHSARRP